MKLDIWTVTLNPSDYPGKAVARRWVVTAKAQVATDEAVIADDLAKVRLVLEDRGLVCIPRSPEDDPVIVESWV